MHQHRFTYANVASTLALTIALGGGGIAVANGLASNSVGSAQVINYSIEDKDLSSDSVGTNKIKPNGVNGGDVRDDSLTGSDVDESTLYPSGGFSAMSTLNSGGLTATPTEAASVSIDVPVFGYAVYTVEATFSASGAVNGRVLARPTLDGIGFGPIGWDAGDADAEYDQRQSVTQAVYVQPGVHTFALSMSQPSGAAAAYDQASVSVLFVAADVNDRGALPGRTTTNAAPKIANARPAQTDH